MRRFGVILGGLALAGLLTGCASKQTSMVRSMPEEETVSVDSEENLSPEQGLVKQILEKNGYSTRGKPVILLVQKQSRKLTVFKGTTPLKTYPIVMGANYKKDKLCQGDMCTPEGVYKMVAKYPHQRWDKFVLLNYPNNQNWLKFSQAKKKGLIPPDAKIGGEIGIHGTSDELKNVQGVNWTLGCISLRNKHLDEIYPLINEATLIVINKQ